MPSHRPSTPAGLRSFLMLVLFTAMMLPAAALPVPKAGQSGSERLVPRPTPLAARSATTDPVDPLRGERVLVIGDSLTAQATPHLVTHFERLGVEHRVFGVGRSGLLNPDLVNWKEKSATLVAEFRPTIVVVEFCCNYPPPYLRDDSGAEILPGSETFKQRWAEKAAEVADTLTATGARLYWVITPPADGPVQATIDAINATTWEAVERADPPIRVVRWDQALTADTGQFRMSIPVRGRETVVREPDRLHFTDAGAKVAATSVVDTLVDDSVRGWAPFGDPVGLVLQARRDLTGLPDDLPAAKATAARLQSGTGDRISLVSNLALGDRWGEVVEPLVRLHLTVAGTPPDHLWLRRAIDRAQRGTPLIEEAENLLHADGEADSWSSDDDASFLDRLHRTALGRPPAAADAERWERELAMDGSRAQIVTDIANSSELVTRSMGAVRTISLFEGLLRRVPTDDELALWLTPVAEGEHASLVRHLLESDEYADRIGEGRRAPRGPGVVGGVPIDSERSPWLVALVRRGDHPADGILCAGALIDRSWVVTTAGCVLGRPVGSIDVVVGWAGGDDRPDETVPARWIHISPSFEGTTLDGDIAVIELAEPVRATPIEVGPEAEDSARSVVGWSTSLDGSPDGPSIGSLGAIDDAGCLEAHGPAFHPASMRCAGLVTGGVDACQGGAPLVARSGSDVRLVGLVSWGSGCAEPGAPAVAVRLDADEPMLELDRYRPPYPSAEDAVVDLFVTIESRLPTDDERSRWTELLTDDPSANADLALELVRSDRRRTIGEPLARTWIALSGDAPTLADMAYWTTRRLGEEPLHRIIGEMTLHPQVVPLLQEGTDDAFVIAAYHRIVGQAPTESELTAAVDDIAGGQRSRAGIAIDLARSRAGVVHLGPLVGSVLAAHSLLDRTPTPAEFSDWSRRLGTGTPVRDVVHEMLRSEEMANRS